MIPTTTNTVDDLESLYVEENEKDQPTYTYRLDLEKLRVQGTTDGQAAMKQVIYKVLNTERYRYNNIYSDNYGIELESLYGQSLEYAEADLPRILTEALTWDQRILSLKDFTFMRGKKCITVNFTAVTIYGDVEIENVEVSV